MCKSSICWDCAKAVNNGCPWSMFYKPVPNWKAIKTTVKQFNVESVESYVVLECPLFEDDSKSMLRKKFRVEYGMSYKYFYILLHKGLIIDDKLVLCEETQRFFQFKARQTFLRLKKLRIQRRE